MRASSRQTSKVAPEPGHDVSNYIWGTDVLQLSALSSQDQFPFGLSRNNDWRMNNLGLGRSSPLLNVLFDRKKIPSRAWGLFWGWTGSQDNSQMDGSLTLGGYDTAKTSGSNFTDNLVEDEDCKSSMVVTVSDIVLNHPNGSITSIFGDSRGVAMRACVQPDYPLITLPYEIYQTFANATEGVFINRSTGVKVWGMNFEASTA